ncbi:MAG: class I SAM-dependent methyltransferase [Synergistaceae bacterium]|nr:class I SAM-dependent methyltransferase [Synergistaceae bacterium]
MLLSDGWKDYAILDAGDGYKLERWADITLLRPDPQAIWPMRYKRDVDATYIRSSSGGGHWEYARALPESWSVCYRDLKFIVRPTGFKHTGLFPEQAVNWDWMMNLVKESPRPFKVLNLFAYTGGASVALASVGAQVVHLDAAKGIVAWARQNAEASGIDPNAIRYIIDDAMKFVLREGRRGNRYDGILMDPPSYGRGPTGEMWKLDKDLYTLVAESAKLLSRDARFFLINSYTTGLAPSILTNVLKNALPPGRIQSDEVALPIERDGLVLPCGASGRWMRD